MTAEMKDKLLAGVIEDLTGVIRSSWDQICADMGRAAVARAGEEGEFKYRVGTTVVITPRGDEYHVESTASWSVKQKAVSVGTDVTNQTEIDLEA